MSKERDGTIQFPLDRTRETRAIRIKSIDAESSRFLGVINTALPGMKACDEEMRKFEQSDPDINKKYFAFLRIEKDKRQIKRLGSAKGFITAVDGAETKQNPAEDEQGKVKDYGEIYEAWVRSLNTIRACRDSVIRLISEFEVIPGTNPLPDKLKQIDEALVRMVQLDDAFGISEAQEREGILEILREFQTLMQ